MLRKSVLLILFICLGLGLVSGGGCSRKEKELTVYAGQGLRLPLEEIKTAFEQKQNVSIHIIYAGSGTLLRTIIKSGRGDVFIPGEHFFIEKAGELISSHQYVALHVPTIGIHSNNPKAIRSFEDLGRPGMKVAVGNGKMNAIGRISESIIARSGFQDRLGENIVIKASTVDELIQFIIDGVVDAAIIWTDMLHWPEAGPLTQVSIEPAVNEIKEIHAAVLATSKRPELARQFVDYTASDGKSFFTNNGFGHK